MFCITISIGTPSVLLLQIGRVTKQDLRKLIRRAGAVDGPAKPLSDQARKIAGMIDMRVGQNDRVNLRRWYRKRLPISQAKRLESLEHAAVNEDLFLLRFNKIFRTGDGQIGRASCRVRVGSWV